MMVSPKGLNSAEVDALVRKHGYNELPELKNRSLLKVAGEVVTEPMFALLIACALMYLFMGDRLEGLVMMSTIFLLIAIAFYQHYRSEKALDALKKLSSPRVSTLRNGLWIKLPGRELVPGDVIRVAEGDRLAADVNVMEGEGLEMDESMLTGEAFSIKKSGDDKQLYSGTLVVKGRGLAVVDKTGVYSKMGSIATGLAVVHDNRTLLQKEMSAFVRTVAMIGIVLCLLIVAVYYGVRGDFLQAVLNGLAAAMAILPEEFPVVFTLFLAMGAWRLAQINVLTRQPSVIEALGSASILCSDKTGTITQNTMVVSVIYDGSDIVPFSLSMPTGHEIIRCAALASSIHTSDPMEKAMLAAYQELGLPALEQYDLAKEYGLSDHLLLTTRLFHHETGDVSGYAKGAPETVIAVCRLSEEKKTQVEQAIESMASGGYRVIGMAKATTAKATGIPEDQQELVFEFIGLMGLEDPVRPEVADAVETCKKAGINVYMITGDHSLTAAAIGRKIGLNSSNILTGQEIEGMNDEELRDRLAHCNIFARILPEQKLRLVTQFQQMGKVVAMTGDGVNDAPALKKADIGIAMGNKGTDVAREAARLVLLDDNFASIVSGIRMGRRIYDNLQKAMSYIIAIHIPIIGLTLMPAFTTTMPLLLLPLHIILMELIIDPVCSVAFEFEKEEKGIMNRPPRKSDAIFFNRKHFLKSIGQGVLLFIMVLAVYLSSFEEGHTDGQARMIAFFALIIGNLFLIFTNLSSTRTILDLFLKGNKVVFAITAAVVSFLAALTWIPELRTLMNFEMPTYFHFTTTIAGSLIIMSLMELMKLIRIRKGSALS